MINCAIYPRKSKQADNSDSIDTQIDMCTRYLNDKYGIDNYSVQIYDGDYGITGHSVRQRKDFQRMMNDIAGHKIQLVLIQRYDRIARNTRDFCNLYHEMEQNGCNLVSVSQQIDTTTPYGKKFMYDQASMAELEWALCSERRKDANRYARSIGKCNLSGNQIPFGYKPEMVDGIRRLVKDKEVEAVVLDIFDYYRKYSNYTSAARYVEEKYNISLRSHAIRRMISNPIYYGKYRENEAFCEPYLSKTEWDKLQQKKPCIRQYPLKIDEVLFSGMIRCPKCGHYIHSGKGHTGNYHYRFYNCQYHTLGLCDLAKSKSEKKIEQMLIDYLDDYMKHFQSYSKDVPDKRKNANNVNFLDKYKKELERLNNMYLKGRINEDFYDSEYNRINNLISQAEIKVNPEDHIIKMKAAFSDNWKEMYYSLDKLQKKLFWRGIIEEIIIDNDMNISNVIFL